MNNRFIGKSVWVSKLLPEENKLSALLKSKGIKVLSYPLIELTENNSKKLRQVIDNINEYSWVIIPSPNAVHYLSELIAKSAIVNITAKFCCLGIKTQIKANSFGFITEYFSEEYNIQNLINTMPLDRGQKILYFTSDRINKNIDISYITEKKCSIKKEVLYQNKPYSLSSKELGQLNRKNIDLVIVYSYSAIDSLCLNAPTLKTNIYDTPLICIGPLTAKYARSKQFTKVKYSSSTEDNDILKACLDCF